MRVVLFGAGEFGIPTFAWLHEHHDVVGVFTQPDKPAGRKRQLTPAPAASWAQDLGLPVFKTDDVNSPDMLAQLQALQPDLSVVIAFGQKLSPAIIRVGGQLVVNLHSSLLPRLRGAAPINHAILSGETTTGVSVIALAQQMDAGLIYKTLATPIDPQETAGELHDRLAQLGPAAIQSVIDDMEHNRLQGQQQDHALATRAPKLSKADSPIVFDQFAEKVRAHIHGLTPWPGASAMWHRPGKPPQQIFLRRVRVADQDTTPIANQTPGQVLPGGDILCNPGRLEILELQLPGKRVMTRDEFTRGNPIAADQSFTSD